jgi:hypothetical protein
MLKAEVPHPLTDVDIGVSHRRSYLLKGEIDGCYNPPYANKGQNMDSVHDYRHSGPSGCDSPQNACFALVRMNNVRPQIAE